MAELKQAKPLTIPESMWSLREHILRLKSTLASGNKSEIDRIGSRLDEIVAWLDAVHDDERTNPRSVATIHGELPPIPAEVIQLPAPAYPASTKYEGQYGVQPDQQKEKA